MSEDAGLAATDQDLHAGQRVGEYVVEAKIGEGGFGTVFRAVHPLIGKQVAIKVLTRQYSAQPEMVSRFVAEARAVNQIRHRNIIDIFAFGQLDDGRHYYVMELLDGAPLDVHLEQVGRMPLPEAIGVLRAVGKALDAAHDKGIAHRDLKPENVFLVREPDGTIFPKLLDFGIAKLLATPVTGLHKTRTGAPIGTPYYMSPEQCRGRDVDHRTDVYAFGCVAYELLTGVVPFDGDDYMDILLKQLHELPPAASARVPELPPSIDAALAWMLAKDPAARPANLAAAVRALEQAAAASGIDVPHAPRSELLVTPRSSVAAVTPTPAHLGSAATVDLATVQRGAARPRRTGLWIGLAIAAVAVGAATFVIVQGQRESGGGTGSGSSVGTSHSIGTSGIGSASVEAPVVVSVDAGATKPALVTIDVQGVPAGTEVYGPRGLVGVAPGPIQLERGDGEVILTFRADGFVSASQAVTPASDQALAVTLAAKPSKPKPAPKVRRSAGKGTGTSGTNPLIEDPFKSQ